MGKQATYEKLVLDLIELTVTDRKKLLFSINQITETQKDYPKTVNEFGTG